MDISSGTFIRHDRSEDSRRRVVHCRCLYGGRDGLKRHSFAYMCDVEAYMNTLEKIKTLEGRLFIPSHGDAEESATETAELNLEKTRDTIDLIRDVCSEEISRLIYRNSCI